MTAFDLTTTSCVSGVTCVHLSACHSLTMCVVPRTPLAFCVTKKAPACRDGAFLHQCVALLQQVIDRRICVTTFARVIADPAAANVVAGEVIDPARHPTCHDALL